MQSNITWRWLCLDAIHLHSTKCITLRPRSIEEGHANGCDVSASSEKRKPATLCILWLSLQQGECIVNYLSIEAGQDSKISDTKNSRCFLYQAVLGQARCHVCADNDALNAIVIGQARPKTRFLAVITPPRSEADFSSF